MAETMSKEDAAKLAERNPVPAAQREIQTMQVDKGEPAAPEPAKPDVADLQAKLKAAEAKNVEYKDALVKKDSAVADAKAARDAALAAKSKGTEETKKPEDGPDIEALINSAVAKQVAERDDAQRKSM